MKLSVWPARLCLLFLIVALIGLAQVSPVTAEVAESDGAEDDGFDEDAADVEEDMDDVEDEDEDEDDDMVDLSMDDEVEVDPQEGAQQEVPEHIHVVPYILNKDSRKLKLNLKSRPL